MNVTSSGATGPSSRSLVSIPAMSRAPRLIAPLLLALCLGGCGGDDDESQPSTVGAQTAETADLGRYCELVGELDQAGRAVFAEVESNPNATREDFEAAEREFVESQAQTLEELTETAPSAISADAGLVVESLRARAGLVDEPPPGAGQAESRVRAFEKQNC